MVIYRWQLSNFPPLWIAYAGHDTCVMGLISCTSVTTMTRTHLADPPGDEARGTSRVSDTKRTRPRRAALGLLTRDPESSFEVPGS